MSKDTTYSTAASKTVMLAAIAVLLIYWIVLARLPWLRDQVMVERVVTAICIVAALWGHRLRQPVSIRRPADHQEHIRYRWSYIVAIAGALTGLLGFGGLFAIGSSVSGSMSIVLAILAALGLVLREMADWLYRPFVVPESSATA